MLNCRPVLETNTQRESNASQPQRLGNEDDLAAGSARLGAIDQEFDALNLRPLKHVGLAWPDASEASDKDPGPHDQPEGVVEGAEPVLGGALEIPLTDALELAPADVGTGIELVEEVGEGHGMTA